MTEFYKASTNWEVVKLLKKTLDRSIKIRKGEHTMNRSKSQFNEIYKYYAKKRADAVTEFMDYNGLWGEFKVSGYKRPTMFLKWVKGIVVYPDGTFEQNDDWIAPRFRKE